MFSEPYRSDVNSTIRLNRRHKKDLYVGLMKLGSIDVGSKKGLMFCLVYSVRQKICPTPVQNMAQSLMKKGCTPDPERSQGMFWGGVCMWTLNAKEKDLANFQPSILLLITLWKEQFIPTFNSQTKICVSQLYELIAPLIFVQIIWNKFLLKGLSFVFKSSFILNYEKCIHIFYLIFSVL